MADRTPPGGERGAPPPAGPRGREPIAPGGSGPQGETGGDRGPARRRPASEGGAVTTVLQRNIQALIEARRAAERRKTWAEAVADRVTAFTGSMVSVWVHLAIFGTWIVVNSGVVPGVEPFDPFPFVMLAMGASVEAIFLTTFVLISQNRMAVMNERRADLDLQISLLSEHEVTRLITMVDGIAERLGVGSGRDADLEELKRDVPPEEVLEEIERAEEGSHGPPPKGEG